MSFSDRVMDLVDEDFHLAVRVGTLPDSASLAARRLGTQHTAICAAPSYLARWGQPTDLDELQSHRAVAYARAGQVAPWRVQAPDIHAVWPRARYLPAKIRVAVDALVARIPALIDHPAIAPAIATNESQEDALAGARASVCEPGLTSAQAPALP